MVTPRLQLACRFHRLTASTSTLLAPKRINTGASCAAAAAAAAGPSAQWTSTAAAATAAGAAALKAVVMVALVNWQPSLASTLLLLWQRSCPLDSTAAWR
jgi:hypothetical protein